MTQSILVFDFGSNEDAAQQARHKLEGWKQTLHLGEKIRLKFDRKGSAADSGKDGGSSSGEEASKKGTTGEGATREGKSAAKKSPGKAKEPADSKIQLLVRLDFSGHEKLSHNRWLARIPSEEPFKSAKSEIIHSTDPRFAASTERFDSLA
jgi:hypothetical protein